MHLTSVLLLVSLCLFDVARVSAHGFVYIVTVDNQPFIGNIPAEAPSKPSVIREISDQGPVKGAANPDVNCGHDSHLASLVADAHPGSVLNFTWRTASLDDWPHNTGPMLTYMASCGTDSCANFNSSNADWFKINQVGMKSDNATWFLADIMAGSNASVTLPATLAPGNWLLRHEIIALHLAQDDATGGAEFYPSCIQLQVNGNQTGGPDPDELVKLPGAYKDTDPGIEINPYADIKNGQYPFPGPPIAKFAQGTATSSPTTTASPHPSGSSSTSALGKCHLKKKDVSSSLTRRQTSPKRPEHRPVSIMSIFFGSGWH